jgi:hypothetical protein
MTPLAGAEISEWVALRRVRGGGVAQVNSRWVESGHRLSGHLAVALGGLLASRLIRLIDPDPTTGVMGRAALTHAGIDRYEQLCQRALQLPGAQFIALCRRFIDNDPDPIGSTPLPN